MNPEREPGLESRSQKRRVAAQKGEAAPDFSREPGQADAALEADIAAFRTEMEEWNKPPRTAALTLRILADRTRDKERIVELEEGLREIGVLVAETRALLEVPDGE